MPQKTAATSLQIRALTERLGRDPRSRVFLDLAKAHLAAGDPGEAVRVCREGLEKHPRYHSARVILGKALVAAGSHGEAATELGKVVSEAPDNILARRLLAEAQEAGGRPADALSTYRSLLLLTPGEPEIEARIADLEGRTREATPVTPLPVEAADSPVSAAPPPPAEDARVDSEAEFETIDVRPDPGLPPGGSGAGMPEEPEEPGPLPPAVTLDASEMKGIADLEERPTEVIAVPPEPPASAVADNAPGETAEDPLLEEASDEIAPAAELVLAEFGAEALLEPAAGPATGEPAPHGEDAEALPTPTLAELYVEQGMPQRAVRVYEKLLTDDPGNREIQAKLSRLRLGEPSKAVAARRKIRALESWLGKIMRTRNAQSRT